MQLRILGIQGSNNINLVRAATAKLTDTEAAAILVKTKLNAENQIQILMDKGLSEAEAKAALATAQHSVTNVTATGTTKMLTTATASFGATLKGLGVAMMSNPILLIGTVIATTVGIISFASNKIKQHYEDLKQKADEVTQTYQSQAEELNNTKEQLDKLKDKYAELSKGVDEHNRNISLTDDKYSEYLDICNQIGDMFPSLIQGFDDQGNAILRCKGNVEELTKAYEEEIKAANGMVISQGKDTFKSFKKESKDFVVPNNQESNLTSKGIESLERLLNSENLDDALEKEFGYDEIARIQIGYALEKAGLKRPKIGLNETSKDYYKRYVGSAIRDNKAVVEAIVTDWNNQVDEATQNVKTLATAFVDNSLFDEKFSGLTSQDKSTIQKWVDDFSIEFLYGFDNVSELYDYLSKWLNDFVNSKSPMANPEAAKTIKQAQEEIKEAAEKAKKTFADIFKPDDGDKDNAFTTYIEQYIDDVTKLKSALANLSEGGIDSKDLEELQRTFPELAVSGDKLDSAIRSLIDTKNKGALWELGKAVDGIVDEEDKARAEAYKETLISLGEIPAPAILNVSESIDKFEKSKDVLKSASEEMAENGEIANDTLKSIIELMDEGENYIDYLDIENGKIKLNTDAWEARAKAAIAADIAKLEAERQQIERENKTLKENIKLLSARNILPNFRGKPIPVAFNESLEADAANAEAWNKELEEKTARLEEIAAAEEVLNALNQTIEDAFSSAKSSSEKSSSKTKEESTKTFNWIETAIDRIQRKVDSFSKVVSSRFKKLSSRQNAAKDEISEITKQIELQEKAYKKYIELAESVNLSEDIKKRIRDGSIEITEYDEKTAELIDKYLEMYEASIDCKNAVDDLHESLASLYEDEFNRLQTEFGNRIALLEYLSNMYNTGISTLEANGYMANKEFYSALTTVTERNVELLKEELSSLESALQSALSSGEIEKYSESWYEQVIAINGVKESIASATQQLAEYAREMQQIDWGYFDFLQERISDITAESEFLIDLLDNNKLFDDKGNLTNEGMSVLGLHAVDYNVLMAQADKYAEEMCKIEQELANDPYNTDLIERRQELLELQRESILAAEDEKQAIIDLVQNGIDEELDKLKELIDAYKDALDSAKDLHDYEKRINDQTSKLAAIDKQIQSLSGDDSEENQATLQKLYAERAEALENLQETEYDRYISEQKKLLDNLYNKYESLLNQRLDNVDVLISEMISTVNLNSDTIGQTIQMAASNVGYTLTDSMSQIWANSYGNMQSVVAQYGQGFLDTLTTTNNVLQQISQQVANMQSHNNNWANGWIGGTNNSFIPDISGWTPGGIGGNTGWNNGWDDGDITLEDDPIIPSPVQSSAIRIGDKIYAGGATIYRGSDGHSPMSQYYGNDPYYFVLGEQNGYYMVRHHSKANGITGWFRKQDVFKAYKKGGLVDYTGLAQVDGTPSEPESFLDAKDTKNVKGLTDELRKADKDKLFIDNGLPETFRNISPNLIPAPNIPISSFKMPEFDSPIINQSNNVNLGGINIDHVLDYNDLCDKMQHDGRFEQMIQEMTLGRLVGRSSLSKYNVSFKR